MTRPRMVAVTASATYPPRRGNQVRNAELFRALAENLDVDSFSLTFQRSDLPLPPARVAAAPGWVDHRLRDPLLMAWTAGLGRAGYPPVFSHRLLGAAPRRRLARALSRADVVLVSPPYHFDWVRQHTPAGVPVVYDEHSIELDMYRPRSGGWTRAVAAEVERAERGAAVRADLVFVTCDDDEARVREWGAREVAMVPNGVDVERFRPSTDAERVAARVEWGIADGERVAVFVGSGHPPNVEAVAALEQEAECFRGAGIRVLLAGRSSLGRGAVAGIDHLGEVPDVARFLRVADITLCPLRTGSGTSIKVFEYLASGVPLLSTDFGVRGLGLRDGVHYRRAEVGEFARAAIALLDDAAGRAAISSAARAEAEARFSWGRAGAAAASAVGQLLAGRGGRGA